MESESRPVLRIGELGRRVGVSAHLLRAWERRYGLLQPQRAAGGYRLYSAADEARVRRMLAHLAAGLSAAEAARGALEEEPTAGPRLLEPGAEERLARHEGLAARAAAFARALDAFDEPTAQAVLDRLFAEFTVETVLREMVLPYLHELGERWQRTVVSVAQEHFASSLLRGRLASLARGWGNGQGPQALLACAPGDLHDLALLAFGIALHRQGWRVRYLGADTPLADLTRLAAELRPDLVVLTAAVPERLKEAAEPLSRLSRLAPLALAGAGVSQALADAVGARRLIDDPVTAAERIPLPETAGGRWSAADRHEARRPEAPSRSADASAAT